MEVHFDKRGGGGGGCGGGSCLRLSNLANAPHCGGGGGGGFDRAMLDNRIEIDTFSAVTSTYVDNNIMHSH